MGWGRREGEKRRILLQLQQELPLQNLEGHTGKGTSHGYGPAHLCFKVRLDYCLLEGPGFNPWHLPSYTHQRISGRNYWERFCPRSCRVTASQSSRLDRPHIRPFQMFPNDTILVLVKQAQPCCRKGFSFIDLEALRGTLPTLLAKKKKAPIRGEEERKEKQPKHKALLKAWTKLSISGNRGGGVFNDYIGWQEQRNKDRIYLILNERLFFLEKTTKSTKRVNFYSTSLEFCNVECVLNQAQHVHKTTTCHYMSLSNGKKSGQHLVD